MCADDAIAFIWPDAGKQAKKKRDSLKVVVPPRRVNFLVLRYPES